MTTPTSKPTGSLLPGAVDSEASSALASPVRRRALCFGAAALGAAALAPVGLVRAQSLGDRPLRIILPLSAGSGADGAIRAISNSLAKALGQPVVIENLPGAGGITGTTQIVWAHEPARRLFTAALERNRDEWMLRMRRMGSCPCKQPGRSIARFRSNPSGSGLCGWSAALRRLPIAELLAAHRALHSIPKRRLRGYKKALNRLSGVTRKGLMGRTASIG